MSKKTIVRILNIKLSGLLDQPFNYEFLKTKVHKQNNSRISFYHKKIHFSVLGKTKTSLNVTGVKKLYEINQIQNIFSSIYHHSSLGEVQINGLKIDSISLTCKTDGMNLFKKLKKNSKSLRKYLKENKFNLRNYHTFPGICLKKIGSFAIIFFSTGTINGFGFKTLSGFYKNIKSLCLHFSEEKKEKKKRNDEKKVVC